MVYVFAGLIVVLLVIIWLYRREIKKIKQQVLEIQERPSNQLVTQEFYTPELNELATAINQSLIKERDLRLQLERKEALQQDLLTNLSHDIRTPLTSLDGYIQLLIEAESPQDRDRYLGIIQHRLAKLSALLDQMFLYMKLEDDHYPVDLERVDLKQASLTRLFASYDDFAAKGQEPVLDLGEDAVWVWANEELLDQVLVNAIQNALVHGDGDLTLSLDEAGSLRISNRYTGSWAGDPQDLFNRFKTGEANRSQESHGLGLSIVQAAMEKMGGQVTASLEDEIFCLQLDFQAADSAEG